MTYTFNDIEIFSWLKPEDRIQLAIYLVLKVASKKAKEDFLARHGSMDVRPILYNVEDSIIEFGGAE